MSQPQLIVCNESGFTCKRRADLQEGSKVMGQTCGTPVVPTGLERDTVFDSAQADLALEVVQGAALSGCVV